MEYDYKKGTLIHDFNDNIVKDSKNELKIIVGQLENLKSGFGI